ncbi:hypothetical protein MJO29_016500, partial [Puccinia striiformis f. sp. tritici]
RTKSVEVSGVQLGRFVLGGCLDEANQLEESVLAAVPPHIQTAWANPNDKVKLVCKTPNIDCHIDSLSRWVSPALVISYMAVYQDTKILLILLIKYPILLIVQLNRKSLFKVSPKLSFTSCSQFRLHTLG